MALKQCVVFMLKLTVTIALNELSAIQFTANIIKETFDINYCVHLIDNTGNIFLAKAIISINLMVILTTNSTTFLCKGYVVYTNKLWQLEDIIDETNFEKHQAILIFYGGKLNQLSQNKISRMGNDIILVENFPDTYKISDDITVSYIKDPFKFENSSFRIALFHCPPFISLNGTKIVEGIDVEIIKHSTQNWPIEYIIYNSTTRLWRNMVNDIMINKSDMLVCCPWYEGNVAADVTNAYTSQCLTFVVPKPYLLNLNTFVFKPYPYSVWLSLALFIIAVALISLIFRRYVYKSIESKSISYINAYFLAILSLIRLITLGPLPNSLRYNKYSIRILFSFWCLYCIIITTGYSAGLSTCMTSPPSSPPINTVKDMIKQNIHWGVTGTDQIITYLLPSENGIIHQLINLYEPNMDSDERNERLKTSRDVGGFIKIVPNGYIMNLDTLDEFGLKETKLISDCAKTFECVLQFQKNSIYMKYFNRKLGNFVEHGLIKKWTQIQQEKQLTLLRKLKSSDVVGVPIGLRPSNMKDIQGAFYLLGFGLLFSVVVFIGEVLKMKMTPI